MSSLAKMLSILDLFSERQPLHTPSDIGARLNLTKPTVYRYLRELVRAGLLSNSSGSYRLGPRVIELDYQVRKCDPLLTHGESAMRQLAEDFRGDVILSSIYGEKVVNTFHFSADPELKLSFGRGQVIPLARSATTKVILAFAKRTRLKLIYQAHASDPAFTSIGSDWRAFLAAMNAIRSKNYACSFGELDTDHVGIAAPIRDANNIVTSAVTLIVSRKRFALHNADAVAEAVRHCARRLEAAFPLRPPAAPIELKAKTQG